MKIIKTSGFILIQILLCLGTLELIAWAFLAFSANPLYRARKLLRFDQEVGWFQKSDLTTSFEGKNVWTDKNGYRIQNKPVIKPTLVTLGPSSAFGWGVEAHETYSFLVSKRKGLPLLNASGIGHSIYQGDIMWKKISPNFSSGYAIIAYGVNDLDKFRFYDSESSPDEEYFSRKLETSFPNSVPASHFLNMISLAMNLASHQLSCEHIRHPSVRVPWENFQFKLFSLINEMRSKGITPVLINTPFHLVSPNPEFNVDDIESAYAQASQLAKERKCQEAHKALMLARSFEPENILFQVMNFNDKLREFALKEKIIYIDAFSLLSENNKEVMFVDPVHPSAEGHRKIAGQIIESVFN